METQTRYPAFTRHLPNAMTALRIIGTLAMLFIVPLSPAFYIIYTVCGLTDVLDGLFARWFHAGSELGAKLDSAADLLYYAVMLIRLMPVLWKLLPLGFWCSVGVVVLLRLTSYGVAAVKYRRFASQHTWLNKITGAGVFGVPYVLELPVAVGYCCIVCAVSMLGTLEELVIHLRSKVYHPEVRCLFQSVKMEQ
ncbi:MAG: CDP-alcohol phosphatidyltransferase family protein [Oscillospiraceae bacterium]|nr:CDP-alcohol phosphatidyltransferase family protein [Oscillospiraceae bacterium]